VGLRNKSSRTVMSDSRAIIDIGSNTVRLVIYSGSPRAPRVVHNEKVTARLGRAVAESGKLGNRAMTTARAALARYAMLLRVQGVTDVETVATAAVRDASNGAEFLASLVPLGLKPRLLSGEEEAVTSAMGVIGAFPGASGVVADLGGGSLELIHIDGARSTHGTSLPLGTLRLPALRADGAAKFSRRIAKQIKASGWQSAGGETLYLVGGSFRAFARFAMIELGWPLDDPHGYTLSPVAAVKACQSILHRKLPLIVPGVSAARIASLRDTAALLMAILREIDPARLVFSAWGLREGLIYAGLPPVQRKQNPLLEAMAAFCDAQGVPVAAVQAVTDWTAAAAGQQEHKELRLAATMLALAVQGVEPNLRAGQAIEWALHKRWIGIGPEAQAVMAACALASAGRGPLPAELAALATPDALAAGTRWGAAIRLARRLSGLSSKVLEASSLTVADGRLVLSVRKAYAALYTDMIEKDLRALAMLLACQGEFRSI
jgi:exopolyphosphatase/guanosine-5'-triphosphate,3'-diphosphate pyrophosphatase